MRNTPYTDHVIIFVGALHAIRVDSTARRVHEPSRKRQRTYAVISAHVQQQGFGVTRKIRNSVITRKLGGGTRSE